MVKVISFCLWGNSPKYNVGAIKNAQLAKELYPDWKCVFYYSRIDAPSAIPQLGLMDNVGLNPVDKPGTWALMLDRFQAIIHSTVDVMIVRDCDSRLSQREKYAVDEWLESDRLFHTMHDHPYHTVPILGGMWGIKKGLFSELGRHAEEWSKTHESRWQVDQDFLTDVVWPIVKNDTLNHDQFFRHLWGGTTFPSPRSGLEFVGQVFDENDITVAEHQTALFKHLKMYGEEVRDFDFEEWLEADRKRGEEWWKNQEKK